MLNIRQNNINRNKKEDQNNGCYRHCNILSIPEMEMGGAHCHINRQQMDQAIHLETTRRKNRTKVRPSVWWSDDIMNVGRGKQKDLKGWENSAEGYVLLGMDSASDCISGSSDNIWQCVFLGTSVEHPCNAGNVAKPHVHEWFMIRIITGPSQLTYSVYEQEWGRGTLNYITILISLIISFILMKPMTKDYGFK